MPSYLFRAREKYEPYSTRAIALVEYGSYFSLALNKYGPAISYTPLHTGEYLLIFACAASDFYDWLQSPASVAAMAQKKIGQSPGRGLPQSSIIRNTTRG